MVKTKAETASKMLDRVGNAGQYLKAGMDAAEDPLDILTRDPAKTQANWAAGIQEATRKGSLKAGLDKAKANDSWKKSRDRAGAHFEERKGDMVTNAMQDYDKRAAAIEAALATVKAMPRQTRDQRIAYSAAYQKAVGAEMDKVYGRKA